MHAFGTARVGRDVEVRYTANSDAVASVSLAFTYGRKGQDGKRPTQWVDGTLWGKQAEALAPYLLKGQQVSVVLEDLRIEDYQTKAGQSGSKLAGRIASIEFAGTKSEGSAAKPDPKPVRTPAASAADMDSDIPF